MSWGSETTIGEVLAEHGGSVKTGPFGTVLKASEYGDSGVPLISVREVGFGEFHIDEKTPKVGPEIVARLPEYVLEEGDIVFARKGSVDRSAVVREPQVGWFLGSDGIRLRLPEQVDPYFVKFWLSQPKMRRWLNQQSTGTTMPSLNQKAINYLPITLPPLATQRSISEALLKFDDKIELNRRMNETLEEMARALFRDWFVDFGPTRRQMEGATDPAAIMGHAFPPENATTLAPLFPAKLGDDGLPEGWHKLPVGELTEIVGGGTPNTKTEEFWEGGTHLWATPRDLSKLSGVFIRDTERKLTEAGLAKVGSGLSPIGSVLMSSRAPIGYLAIASQPVAVNQGFIVMRPSDRFPTHFAKLWCEANMETIEANANGSTFQEISKKNFKPILATIPSAEVMAAFSNVASLLFDKVQANEQENQTLAEMRDLLLPKLMSGEIRLNSNQEVQS